MESNKKVTQVVTFFILLEKKFDAQPMIKITYLIF